MGRRSHDRRPFFVPPSPRISAQNCRLFVADLARCQFHAPFCASSSRGDCRECRECRAKPPNRRRRNRSSDLRRFHDARVHARRLGSEGADADRTLYPCGRHARRRHPRRRRRRRVGLLVPDHPRRLRSRRQRVDRERPDDDRASAPGSGGVERRHEGSSLRGRRRDRLRLQDGLDGGVRSRNQHVDGEGADAGRRAQRHGRGGD